MSSLETGKSAGDKTISTKIPREEFTRLRYVCRFNNETVNAALKRMVLSSITDPKPVRVAGRSVFEYDRRKDNFKWQVILDDGTTSEIDSDLSANALEHLFDSIRKAIEFRNSLIHKRKRGSVPLPGKLVERKA